MYLTLFLFAIALDPDIKDENKKLMVQSAIANLDEKQAYSLNYSLGCESDLHPAIQIHILRYCSPKTWLETIAVILKYRNFSANENSFMQWLEEVNSNSWDLISKQEFNKILFDSLSANERNDLIYHILLKLNPDTIKQFLAILPSNINKYIETFKESIELDGQQIFSQIKNEQKPVKITFEGNHRKCFLEWFYKNALNHQNAYLLVNNFCKADWEWLQNSFNRNLISSISTGYSKNGLIHFGETRN